MTTSTRFAITYDAGYAVLSRALFISPSNSYVQLVGNDVSVRMGWAFRTTFARSCVARASVTGKRVPLTRGVHCWAGRCLVNGAGDGILAIDFEPRQRGYVMGFPVQLQLLLVSVEDPLALATALAAQG
jgi:hypothetical protein